MKRIVEFLAILICLLFAFSAVEAQFNTPTINGTISSNEYGVHTNGQNQQSTGSAQTCVSDVGQYEFICRRHERQFIRTGGD